MHDPIAHMNRWRDIHRARGTSGGQSRPVVTDTIRRLREAGGNASDFGYEIVAAALNDFLAEQRQAAVVPLGDISCPF